MKANVKKCVMKVIKGYFNNMSSMYKFCTTYGINPIVG